LDEPETVAQVEVRENALWDLQNRVALLVEQVQQAVASIENCENAQVMREDITEALRPAERLLNRVIPPHSPDVVIAGTFFDRFDDLTARDFIRTAYRALVPGGVFFFTAADEKRIRKCLAEANVSRQNVSIAREGPALLRVEVRKLQ
jgi:predicted methyltransferase